LLCRSGRRKDHPARSQLNIGEPEPLPDQNLERVPVLLIDLRGAMLRVAGDGDVAPSVALQNSPQREPETSRLDPASVDEAAVARACRAIASPSSVITAADVIGSHRVTRGPSSWNRDISLRAYTMRMPIVTSTAARPTLKATISSRPKPTRRRETALRSTTSA